MVRITTIRRAIDGERGQSTAMIVSMLFLLVLFVGMVANVGQAVNRRIALQTLADAGAFTGATVMGVAMNQIAYWNKWLMYLWDAYSALMSPAIYAHVYPSCELADSLTSAYKGGWWLIYGAMQFINFGFDGKAVGDAAHVTDFNARDLFPSEVGNGVDPDHQIQWGEPTLGLAPTSDSPLQELPILSAGPGGARDLGLVVYLENVDDGTNDETLGLIPSRTHIGGYVCIRSCGPFCAYPTWESQDVDVWQRKKRESPLIFVWAVRAPKTKAVAFDWLFGPDAIPEMTAVAAAKPIGGSIEKAKEEYVAKMVPVDKAMKLGGYIMDMKYSPFMLRKVLH